MNPIICANIGISLPLLFVSSLVLADDAVTELDEVVVTANRTARTIDETLATVTVITRDDIENYHASEITEVLRRVPGLNIINSGGVGKATSLSIRGTGEGHVLVLINGIRQGSATLGTTNFQDIPIDQIDRIEIVRGPRSSLYGSEAIGGVIQIFTKKGGEPSASISIGSHNTLIGNVNFSGKTTDSWYSVNLSSKKTKGIDSRGFNIVFDPVTSAQTRVPEPDNDDYKRNSITLSGGHHFNRSIHGDISLIRTIGDNDFDGSFVNEANFSQQVISGNLSADLNDKTSLVLQVGQAKDNSDNFLNGTFRTRFNTQRDSASLIADIEINAISGLLLGTDRNNAKVDSTTQYDVSSRDNKGVFANYSTQLYNTGLDASLRYDDNEQFGSYKTGGLAISQAFGEKVLLKASYGTAFKAPTFNQLYFPGFGDANLLPQKSKNYELSLTGKLKQGRWEVNTFHNKITDNLVIGATVSNIDKTRIRGIESVLSTRIAGFDLSTNLTYQQPKIDSGANSGNLLRYRPQKIVNLDIDKTLGRWSFGTSIHGESVRYTNAGNTNKLPGYATLDLRTDYSLNKDWSIGLKVANVLDKNYQTNDTYNQDGINGLINIKYSPK